MPEKIIAQIVFDVSRYANDQPASQELEDAFAEGHSQHEQAINHELMAHGRGIAAVHGPQTISGPAEDLWKQCPDSVRQQNADGPDKQGSPVFSEIRKEWPEALKHA